MDKKICSKCGETKPLSSFSKLSSGNVRSTCNSCNNKASLANKKDPTYKNRKELEAKEQEELLSAGLKRCTKCNEIKPIGEYNKNNNPGKINGFCKTCQSERSKKYVENIEKNVKVVPKEKECVHCKQILPIEKFGKSRRSFDGYHYSGKSCSSKKHQKYVGVEKIAPLEKKCTRCKITKPIDEFCLRTRNKDGYDFQCKECKREQDSNRYNNQKENFTEEQILKRRIRTSVHDKFYHTNIHKENSCAQYGIDFNYIVETVGRSPKESFELDHIIPMSIFDYKKIDHIYLSQHPANLRWLDGEENNRKNDKIIWDLIKDNPFLYFVATNVLKLDESYDGRNAKDIKKERGEEVDVDFDNPEGEEDYEDSEDY